MEWFSRGLSRNAGELACVESDQPLRGLKEQIEEEEKAV
jgi:hypothetical protein